MKRGGAVSAGEKDSVGRMTYKPDSHISCDLIVPAPSCVQLSSNLLSDDLRQTTFIGGVDVFIIREDNELCGQAIRSD